MRRSDPKNGASQAGLTLVELLVSMLILGFVLTLVSEAVFQVAQVSRSAQAVTAQLSSRWSSGWAAAPILANLVAPPEATEGQAFQGGAFRLSGYTTQSPFAEGAGMRPIVLELRSARDGSLRSDLVAVDDDSFGKAASEAVIATFDAKVEFAYADITGQISPMWPLLSVAANRDGPEIPSAVLVRDRISSKALMWYGFQGETLRSQPPPNPFATSP